ncbi:MAG TPA: HepT-like ribonuclease domain-containing protein [Edaphobacter sp.]|nr:HepT-like ribonuclease domain-containing protein [Edaphobacter sp.]
MPQRELKLYLWDIRRAGEDILHFTKGKELVDYLQDPMLCAAVERKFEIIGEALSQAERLYPELRGLIDDSRQIIAFRNRVIHGYASLENRLVWSIVQVYLQPLLKQVETLLADINRLQR